MSTAELQILTGAVTLSPLAADLATGLEEAQVTHTAGQRSGFQLTFRLAPHSRLATEVLPVGSIDAPTRVVLALVLQGQVHVLSDGVVTRHDAAPSAEPGQGRLTVTGVDLSQLMDLVDLSGVPMPGMPLAAQAAFVLARYAPFGVIPQVLPTPLVDVPNPLEDVHGQQGTDYAHVKRIADAVGYAFYVEPGPSVGTSTAYWGPQIRTGEPQPALSLDLGPDRNVESLQFSFDGLKRTVHVAFVHDENTRAPIPVPIPDITPLSPPQGPRVPLPLRYRPLNRSDRGDQDAPSRVGVTKTLMKGLARAAESADAITASGSLDVSRYGRFLAARRPVAVRGAGEAYDGTWFVTSTTTTLARGALTQRFSLVRNAFRPFGEAVQT